MSGECVYIGKVQFRPLTDSRYEMSYGVIAEERGEWVLWLREDLNPWKNCEQKPSGKFSTLAEAMTAYAEAVKP